MADTLFPSDLPSSKWTEFKASGFSTPVCGVIYPDDKPAVVGMPLGGIDTGCIDLETTGLLGLSSIFNSLSPRQEPANVPFLGVKLEGETHLLSTMGLIGVKPAKRIRYWGHYPVADMEFELDAPLSVGVRAWSPFIPGDTKASMVPGAVFEVHLRNLSSKTLKGTLAGSFPGFSKGECGPMRFFRHQLSGAVNGGLIDCSLADSWTEDSYVAAKEEPAYVLGFLGDSPDATGKVPVRMKYSLDLDATAWKQIDKPGDKDAMVITSHTTGMSVATDFSIPAGGTQVLRLILAWHDPVWMGNGTMSAGGKKFWHMYARHYPDVNAVADYLAKNHQALLKRILAWQGVIYAEKTLPGWLQDSLINSLHMITETAVWGQAPRNEKHELPDWCKEEDGLFALNECPRGCPQMECLPCSFYGNLPLVYFFPETALSTLRGYKGYQYENGQPPWVFGGCTIGTGFYDLAAPGPGYQTTLNGFCVVEMANKIWLRTGDKAILTEFYDMCKRATIWTMNLNKHEGGVISMAIAKETEERIYYDTEWFEAPEPGWRGMATHTGGIRLAQLRMMQHMAEGMGDTEFAGQCRQWFDSGTEAMEKYLWAGSYYLNFFEKQTGIKSDLIFGFQLDGQWISRFNGTGDVFPAEHAEKTLETIKKVNIALSKSGATNYANPDGTPANVAGYGMYSYLVPEVIMLAMTYIYAGQKEFGLKLAEKCWENIVCAQGLGWYMPNILRGDKDTGEFIYGTDYYQNMILWSLPAVLEGQDLSGPCRKGGLVDRVIKAGQSGA